MPEVGACTVSRRSATVASLLAGAAGRAGPSSPVCPGTGRDRLWSMGLALVRTVSSAITFDSIQKHPAV